MRDRLGLSPGSDVEMAQEGESLRLTPAEQATQLVRRGGLLCVRGGQWKGSRDGTEDLTFRDERIRKVSGME
jgi:hypothetical protein